MKTNIKSPSKRIIRHNIFCLEGEWGNIVYDRRSVHPMLELIKNNYNIDYIYRDIGITEELEFNLKRLTQKQFNKFDILYLAFHGTPGNIHIGKKIISLDRIAKMLKGKCGRRIIHFGGCSILDIDKRRINKFLEQSGAIATTGFTSDIPWLKSTAFELLFFEKLQEYRILTNRNVGLAYGSMRNEYKSLCNDLCFYVV